MVDLRGRDLVTLKDYTREEMEFLWDTAFDLKRKLKRGEPHEYLRGKTLAMLFETPSTRTSISFETAMTQLGGHAQYLARDRLWLGKEETIQDTASVISRYADVIVARLMRQRDLEELAKYASIPVINGSTDYEHPCQTLADFMTVIEKKRKLDNIKYVIAWGWHHSNAPMGLVNSTLYAASKLQMEFVIACPEGYEPENWIWESAKKDAQSSGAKISIVNDLKEAVEGADVINVYMWAPPEIYAKGLETHFKAPSPHIEHPEKYRHWQVTTEVVDLAENDAIVMHCMPAGRGEEVTSEVLDGPKSVILDEAENRLHIQKAILCSLVR